MVNWTNGLINVKRSRLQHPSRTTKLSCNSVVLWTELAQLSCSILTSETVSKWEGSIIGTYTISVDMLYNFSEKVVPLHPWIRHALLIVYRNNQMDDWCTLTISVALYRRSNKKYIICMDIKKEELLQSSLGYLSCKCLVNHFTTQERVPRPLPKTGPRASAKASAIACTHTWNFRW